MFVPFKKSVWKEWGIYLKLLDTHEKSVSKNPLWALGNSICILNMAPVLQFQHMHLSFKNLQVQFWQSCRDAEMLPPINLDIRHEMRRSPEMNA